MTGEMGTSLPRWLPWWRPRAVWRPDGCCRQPGRWPGCCRPLGSSGGAWSRSRRLLASRDRRRWRWRSLRDRPRPVRGSRPWAGMRWARSRRRSSGWTWSASCWSPPGRATFAPTCQPGTGQRRCSPRWSTGSTSRSSVRGAVCGWPMGASWQRVPGSGAASSSPLAARWPPAALRVRLRVTEAAWEGLGAGWGLLRRRRLVVEATGRGAAARARRAALWLPAPPDDPTPLPPPVESVRDRLPLQAVS
jgi:hypothetical protein